MCRTSSSQTDACVWQHVAGLVRDWGEELVGERGLSAVGAVVGATFPREVAEARELCCRAPSCSCRGSARRARPRRCRRGVCGRPRKRARLRLPLGDLRLRRGRRLALGRRGRGRAPRARGLACLGRVSRRPTAARYAAPALFLLAVTIAVLLIRSGLGGKTSSDDDHDRPGDAYVDARPAAGTTRRATTTPGAVLHRRVGRHVRLDLRKDRRRDLRSSSS